MSVRSAEANKERSRRWHEAWGTPGLTALYEECLAEDFRALFFGHGWVDRATYIEQDQRFLQAFTDTEVTVLDVVAEGDSVACRMAWSGVHTGTADGLPATGRRFEIMGFALDRYRDGLVAEHTPLFDRYALHDQLRGHSDARPGNASPGR